MKNDKSWLERLRQKFSETVWLGVRWLEQERCFKRIDIYLNRDPDPAKDKKIEGYFRRYILRPANQRCQEVRFVRQQ